MTKSAVLDSRPGPIGQVLGRPAFLATAIGFMMALSIALALSRKLPDPPPVMMALPPFSLTSEKGTAFGSTELKGKVWIASFMFTSCPTICPKLMGKMAEIQHRTRNAGTAVHLVSISVDPENDTPTRLAEFARRFKASPYRWSFLSGDQKALEDTVVKGFKLAMGKDIESGMQIFHSERFVLVDAQGRIRGYYEADKPGIDALMKDVNYLINVR
ncbi:MAG: SCO family protein [Deltaproteobacteria bacterium]|nr:SCO family protein [Deltaproteobacteria bacterium]